MPIARIQPIRPHPCQVVENLYVRMGWVELRPPFPSFPNGNNINYPLSALCITWERKDHKPVH